jgi:hypothetical protein
MERQSESNSLILFLHSSKKKDTEKLTGLNKVLLVLGRRTGAHREDWGGCG